jgi:large subunit ribosomal protein L32e
MIMEKKLKPRAKPRKDVSSKLKSRKAVKSRKPGFKRQEGFKHVKLKDAWRRPRGKHSKLRKREKARGSLPSPGYGSPREVRGLNRMGYREVRVSTPRELENLNPREEMALIASTVGKRKREEILKLASERKIQVANA